jgi:excinuclease ABC subunit B
MAKRPDRDPAKHSKKDPAKPTRAKAARPDASPLDPALAELLNPAIGEGRAGMGSQTGLQQPPDNSFDRRADFANAHKARKSTQGLGERPQTGYVAKGPAGIDPELADALGYGDSDPTRPLTGEPPEGRDELADIFQ